LFNNTIPKKIDEERAKGRWAKCKRIRIGKMQTRERGKTTFEDIRVWTEQTWIVY
jgi:hypothetical protein